jgi:hypothetical protein
MMFGLEALTVPQHLDAGLEPLDLSAPAGRAAGGIGRGRQVMRWRCRAPTIAPRRSPRA